MGEYTAFGPYGDGEVHSLSQPVDWTCVTVAAPAPDPGGDDASEYVCVPPGMVAAERWVAWHYLLRDGKPTKVPLDAGSGRPASSTDVRTWGTFDRAVSAASRLGLEGIGFVFAEGDGVIGIDLDDVIDTDGRLHPQAKQILDQFPTYAETSPSGRGIKLFAKASVPADLKRRVRLAPWPSTAGDDPDSTVPELEFYSTGRYFTVTGGQHLPARHEPFKVTAARCGLSDCQAGADWLIEAFGLRRDPGEPSSCTMTGGTGGNDVWSSGATGVATTPADNDDDALIERIRRAESQFPDLFDRGDVSRYEGDASRGDFALACMFGRVTRDAGRIERLFGRSALARRQKWVKRPDYRQMTIAAALRETRLHGAAATMTSTGRPAGAAVGDEPLPLNDDGNAVRFLRQHGDGVRYMTDRKQWVRWDGRRWAEATNGGMLQLAREAGRGIAAEAEAAALLGDVGTGRELDKWARSSGNLEHLRAMVTLAADVPAVSVRSAQVDAEPELLTVANGVLNLRTCELQDFDRGRLLSKMVPVAYDPAVPTPRWQVQLDLLTGGDREFQEYLRRAVGYGLSGDTSEKTLFFMYGLGNSGKSTFADVLQRLAGEFFCKTRLDTLLKKRGDGGVPNDVAALAGSRLVVASENDAARRWNESLVKDLTGGDPITARFMRKDFFTFDPTFKIWAYGNCRPQLAGVDEAGLRRFHILPFEHVIPNPRPRREVMAELMPELPGILAWAARGYRDYLSVGLNPPQIVQAASEAFRQENDTLGEFLEARTRRVRGERVKMTVLHQAYVEWAAGRNEHPMPRNLFNEELRKRSYQSSGKSTGGYHYWEHVLLERPAFAGQAAFN